MDPDEVLRLIRRELDDLHSADDWSELAGLVEALDGWLSKGGFLPEVWRAPGAARLIKHMLTGEPDPMLRPDDEPRRLTTE